MWTPASRMASATVWSLPTWTVLQERASSTSKRSVRVEMHYIGSEQFPVKVRLGPAQLGGRLLCRTDE